jgi:pyruvate dehydrogenase E2 component (dihydrolipoamide acetyltransferase)
MVVDQREATKENHTRISPRARNMAAQLGIDFHTLSGSGPNGRIIARDVEIYLSGKKTEPTVVNNATNSAEFADVPLSNIRKIIARSMHESLSNSAQLTHHMSADARKILALRAAIKENQRKDKQNITLNDMVCFAVIRALQKFPGMNSHFLGEKIRTFSKVHLGIAVDTPRGLMVATVRDASDLSLNGLSSRLAETAELCRKGSINPELLSSTSATFTVSNLGNYGVEMFTPVINLPQTAILGVNTITYRPADIGNGIFGFIPFIGLSLTYDHRSVDGGPATLFLKEIREEIEKFEQGN